MSAANEALAPSPAAQGPNLARAKLEEALTFLAPRMTGLRPAGEPRLGGLEGIYGTDALPLAWTPR